MSKNRSGDERDHEIVVTEAVFLAGDRGGIKALPEEQPVGRPHLRVPARRATPPDQRAVGSRNLPPTTWFPGSSLGFATLGLSPIPAQEPSGFSGKLLAIPADWVILMDCPQED
jgi:hypothetical protein